MRILGRAGGLGLPVVAFLAGTVACAGDDKKVELKSVKLAGLEKTIQDLKGKVVVVDFWGYD